MNGTARWSRVMLGGTPVDLMEELEALDLILDHAAERTGDPLGVMSANLDHIHHFGASGQSAVVPFSWAHPDAGSPVTAPVSAPVVAVPGAQTGSEGSEAQPGQPIVRWINLLDGAPLVRQAARLTGRAWPRLAGSDMVGPILDRAQLNGLSVGFLGGMPETLETLRDQLTAQRPTLQVGGYWSPERAELTDPVRSTELAEKVRAAQLDILVVGLGKPRQERWIVDYGALTGARVLLAFGAVVDFLAGGVRRAPEPIRDHGLEWAWRLAMEPRRLARRYLVEGPPAYDVLRRRSYILTPAPFPPDTQPAEVMPAW